MTTIKLTEYSHGAGCGCKISPQILETILKSSFPTKPDPRLLVGNQSKDDAAVYDLGDGRGVVSTTDFFMPIVDDPFDFGRIAATNAISDIYAMGGRPLMAIAILGWPVNVLDAEVAAKVIEGGRTICAEAGITLAGGHSIDAPEPIFGLAVTGEVELTQLKQNNQARPGSKLYLTKPLGIGILTTAQKKKLLKEKHQSIATDLMCTLNKLGENIARLPGVSAMTDVTGFGLLGHLLEICEGSNVEAQISMEKIPVIPEAEYYRQQGCIPGGTDRNYASYGDQVMDLSDKQKQILCDPQTSGGLLIAVDETEEEKLIQILKNAGAPVASFGTLQPCQNGHRIKIQY